jgi:hypothetical protein
MNHREKGRKLFSYEIPEVAHLPEAEREVVVKRAAQAPSLQRYRRMAPAAFVVLLLAGIPVLVFLPISLMARLLAIVCYAVIAPFLLFALKIFVEVMLLRAEARKAVGRGG